MSDLIDRAAANAALEKLDELMRHRAETEDKEFVKFQVGITLARCEIDAIPTIDAAPVVHARWILHPEIGPGDADKECSACGEMSLIWSHYCHSCGARMDADAPERVGEGQRAALEGGQHGQSQT